jgi:hypothetical protein
MSVGLRVNVADLVSLREPIEISQFVQTFATVARQSFAKTVTKTGGIIIGRGVSLALIAA